MKRIYSLKGRDLFKEVNIKGRKFYGNGLKLSVIKRKERHDAISRGAEPQKTVKIGISVPKRYGNAAERNKAKRRIRAVCRTIIPEMNSGIFMVIRAEWQMKDKRLNEIQSELTALMAKAGVYADVS